MSQSDSRAWCLSRRESECCDFKSIDVSRAPAKHNSSTQGLPSRVFGPVSESVEVGGLSYRSR